jgi:peptide deformylase
MSIRDVVIYPQVTLRKKSETVREVSDETRALIEDMKETMYSSKGIGLAAPQVGVNQRVIVVDVTPYEPEERPFALINPEIVSGEGEVDSTEGCLSVPGFLETIKRRERVIVRGIDEDGKHVELEATGMLAICLQHEIDHLNGMTIIERLSPLKRELIRKKLKKAARDRS